MDDLNKKTLVIIGGGFTGTLVARNLEKRFKVILIDGKDYFEFVPGVLRTIVNPNNHKNIEVMHKELLKKAQIIQDKVTSLNKDYVMIGKQRINFDYLLISTGSSYNIPIKEENIV